MKNPRQRIFNNMARDWDERAALTGLQKKTVDKIIRRTVGADDSVLDIGCGTGVLAPCLLERIGKTGRITGIDISDRMIKLAKEKHSDPRVSFAHGDIYNYSFGNQRFTRIIVFSAFPHLHEKRRALDIFHSLLFTGGKLVIFHVESSERINSFHKENTGPVIQDDYLPSPAELRTYIDRSKWKILKQEDREGLYLAELFSL